MDQQQLHEQGPVVRDGGEPLLGLADPVRVSASRDPGDDRADRARLGVVERLQAAQALLPAGVHLLVRKGHHDRADVRGEGPRSVSDREHLAQHTTGAAVDVTLCDDGGAELELTDDGDLRQLLRTVLTKQGFVNDPQRWWHWSYGDLAWAEAVGAEEAVYGAASPDFDHPPDARALAVLSRCDNTGRWGPEDALGTLNHITPAVRVAAAALVREGRTVSLAKPLDPITSALNPRPAWHVMHLETDRPYASADSLHLQVHGLASTHLDALGHMFLDGRGYNGRRQHDVVRSQGVEPLDIGAVRDGILTRGVLLDVAAASGRPWLPPGQVVDIGLLESAERRQGVALRSGDALFVHVGLERREAAEGPEDPSVRAGIDVSVVEWLQRREVAVYSGDCIEVLPETGRVVPMPLHQIGIARMGLTLLDCPSLSRLLDLCEEHGRWEFLLSVAPLVVPGGTGSPVNPLAVF